MQRLKQVFESLGFANVETFIASGNVIFESRGKSAAALEAKIEAMLQAELGYEVKTFIRSDTEVGAVAACVPFESATDPDGATLYIGFLKTAPNAATQERIAAAQTTIDDFRIIGRELYWRCRVASSESTFSGAKLEKTLGMPTTLRNANTVRRLAAKYPPAN